MLEKASTYCVQPVVQQHNLSFMLGGSLYQHIPWMRIAVNKAMF